MMWAARHIAAPVGTTTIIGVQDTGGRGVNGATLKQVSTGEVFVAGDSGIIAEATLAASYFDEHPSYAFEETTDAEGNVFCALPRAYWWRGNLPDITDGTTSRWTMLLSPTPVTITLHGVECVFAANQYVYKSGESWLDSVAIGKYRGHNAGDGKIGSKPLTTVLGNVTFTDYQTQCAANGEGYHMVSLFEWQELLARAVIEKSTFQLVPEASRTNLNDCIYRGINHFAYGPTGATDVRSEWMDGVRIDGSGKIEHWSEPQGSLYSATDSVCPVDTAGSYAQLLFSGGAFNFLFLAATLGSDTSAFLPDYSGRAAGHVNKIASCGYYASSAVTGAMYSTFSYTTSDKHATVGSRLCKR